MGCEGEKVCGDGGGGVSSFTDLCSKKLFGKEPKKYFHNEIHQEQEKRTIIHIKA